MSDEYCYSEKCRYRHWQSGSVPTHRKGSDCPEPYTPNTEAVREQYTREQPPHVGTVSEKEAEFRRWHAAEIRKAKAEALREAAEAMTQAGTLWVNGYGRGRRQFYAAWISQRADRIEAAP